MSERVRLDDFNAIASDLDHTRPYSGEASPGLLPPVPDMRASWTLPFAPIEDALVDAPDDPEWMVPGLVARTAVTLLASRPKVGKTTLMFGLFRALRDGMPFLGAPTRPTSGLLLTEERQLTLGEKQRLFGLAGSDLHVLMRHQVPARAWPEVVVEAVAYCKANDLGLLVIDTWDKWADLRSDSENSSGDTISALRPLLNAAAENLAVVIVAHQRKGQGKHGEAVRGSNALTGAVDVIVELERSDGASGDGGGRVLLGTSRFSSTPEKLVLDWDRGSATFVVGDYDVVREDATSHRGCHSQPVGTEYSA